MAKPDPVLKSYQILNSPQAELMVRDLIERYVTSKCPDLSHLSSFNGKREAVLEILHLAKSPITDLILQTIQEE